MNGLPASIETYLTDAGFSVTEMLVLKKLLEGEALTLRELAAKTGKSTGVLDQAVKKLLSRRIIVRETVNDVPKVLLKSLDAIMDWMKRDTEEKLKSMKSRAQDFESFVASLKREGSRPDMEYFEGKDGIQKAYMKLLSLAKKEMLFFIPATVKEEEDPLCAFRVQYFRDRRRRGIFSRVLAPDTPLGRRYRSRDPFEYRETHLLPESVFPITFEKVIAGDTVACFPSAPPRLAQGRSGSSQTRGQAPALLDNPEMRACFIHYSELAHTERTMFELLWRQAKEPPTQAQTVAISLPQHPEPTIALSTRSLSTLREFFLSRKSIALFVFCAALAGGITWGLWRHNYNVNLQRVREQVMAIAATAAPEFDAEDIDQVHTWKDVEKPAYKRLVLILQDIRKRNQKVRWAYIMRATEYPLVLEWVADADALDIYANTDLNGDGLDNDIVFPGFLFTLDYSIYGVPSAPPAIAQRPFAEEKPYKDIWGTWISGAAPILDENGQYVAELGVDIDVSEVKTLSKQTFKPVLYFLGFFLLFIFIRLAAFNRSLFVDLLKLLRSRGVLIFLGSCALIALGVTWGMYRYTLNLMKEQVGEKLMSIAATAAPEFDARDLEPLRFARDMKRPEYQRVFEKLNEIRKRNENVTWADIIRPTKDPNIWEFAADADANYNIPLFVDWNKNGIGEEDEAAPPGTRYDASGQNISRSGWDRPMYEWFYDQWGLSVTGSAPIRDSDQTAVAVLDVTTDVTSFYEQIKNKFMPYLWFGMTFVGLLGLWGGYLVVNTKKAGG
jgi:predicted transcriptional regulator